MYWYHLCFWKFIKLFFLMWEFLIISFLRLRKAVALKYLRYTDVNLLTVCQKCKIKKSFLNVKWSFLSAPWDSHLYSFSVFHLCLFFQPPWSKARRWSPQCEYAGYIPVWSSSLDVSVSLWAAYLSNHFYSSKLNT